MNNQEKTKEEMKENVEELSVEESTAESAEKIVLDETPVEEAPSEEITLEEAMAEEERIAEETKEEEFVLEESSPEESSKEGLLEEVNSTEETSAKEESLEEGNSTEETSTKEESSEEVNSTEEIFPEELPTEETQAEQKAKRKAGAFIVLGAIAAVLILLLVVYLGVGMHFKGRFLMGTTVNGTDCVGKTVDEVKNMLQSQVEDYVLTIEKSNGETEEIKGVDIGIKYNGVDIIEDAFAKQNAYAWILSLFKKNNIEAKIDFEYDSAKLDEAIGQLSCLKAENQVAPISATPVYVNGTYEIQEEVYGTQINAEQLYSVIHSSVDAIENKINLKESNCYVLPTFTKDSNEVITAKDELNRCLKANITYSLDGITETVDKTMIVNWLSVDENMAVVINADQVRAFTNTLGTKYNTPNASGQITTPTGKVVEVPNARLGRVVGSAAECDQLMNEIREGKTVTREPLISQQPTPEGQTAWNTTYVEVDLTEQHMWYIVNGAVVFETDVVTGSPGRDTPVGVFTILEKLRNKTLRGEINPKTGKPEYITPVKYWARITWSGVGFHDATWQSAFGGERYKQGYGSHGCINMSLSSVAEFYEMVNKGDTVIVHY